MTKYYEGLGGFKFYTWHDSVYLPGRYFECILYLQGLSEISLGINIGLRGPNVSIHLPFMFFRIGWMRVSCSRDWLAKNKREAA